MESLDTVAFAPALGAAHGAGTRGSTWGWAAEWGSRVC